MLIFKLTYTEASSSKVVWLRWKVDLLSTGGPSHAETQLVPLPSSLPRRFPYDYYLRYQFRDAKKMLMGKSPEVDNLPAELLKRGGTIQSCRKILKANQCPKE